MRRIGIMGGTFNPIHTGHLILAQWVLEELALDEVWFIPTGISYMKASQDIASGQDRIHMTELALRDNPSFKCLDIEVKRDGYTYSYETMEQLKDEYPKASFFFIVGADCLFSIETWREPERIFRNCTLAAAARGEVTMQEMEAKKRELEQKYQAGVNGNASVILIPFIGLAISSTEIRQRIRDGKSVRYLVPDNVIAYIKEKGLYSEKNG